MAYMTKHYRFVCNFLSILINATKTHNAMHSTKPDRYKLLQSEFAIKSQKTKCLGLEGIKMILKG